MLRNGFAVVDEFLDRLRGTVANGVQFVLDHLAVADALILRHKSDEDEQSFAYQNKQEPCTF
jgi:hypothetical protein